MLDAYIIEEIKRQEEERRRNETSRPRLHIEIPRPVPSNEDDPPADEDDHDDEEDVGGTVIRIDL